MRHSKLCARGGFLKSAPSPLVQAVHAWLWKSSIRARKFFARLTTWRQKNKKPPADTFSGAAIARSRSRVEKRIGSFQPSRLFDRRTPPRQFPPVPLNFNALFFILLKLRKKNKPRLALGRAGVLDSRKWPSSGQMYRVRPRVKELVRGLFLLM